MCDHAKCPNRMECYAQKTATFMILGDVCTRAADFAACAKGGREPVDPDEPRRVAEAAPRLGLKHVVITCVTRDDLPDGGAEHFCRTDGRGAPGDGRHDRGLALRFRRQRGGGGSARRRPPPRSTTTTPRPCRGSIAGVRGPQADYRWTWTCSAASAAAIRPIALKTGLMLGLGETSEECSTRWPICSTAGCRMLTLGQYLQPSPAQMPVVRYVPPEEFEELGRLARRIGFEQVASGPLVRSSYHAGEMLTDRR